jgi:hypothetical protein
VNIGTTSINGLEAVHNELFFQCYNHVVLENDPEGLILYHSVPQGAWFGVDSIIVRGISDNIDASVTASKCIAAKADTTVSQALAVVMPARVAPPAVINWVARPT